MLCLQALNKDDMEAKKKAFERMLTIMDELREQCPWDKKQTMDSLRYLTIEELYELSQCISIFIYFGKKKRTNKRKNENRTFSKTKRICNPF